MRGEDSLNVAEDLRGLLHVFGATIERDGQETHGGCIRGCNGRTRTQFGKEKLMERSRRPSLADLTHGEVVVIVTVHGSRFTSGCESSHR